MKIKDRNIVWISWHKIQRSRNIARFMNIPIYEYFENDNIFKRHFLSSLWTIKFLLKNKPDVIFLHYSYLLLLFTILYKKISGKKVVVIADCHNKALRRKIGGFGSRLFEIIKRFSFKETDVTIITNKGMAKDIIPYHNNYYILPDKIPEFEVKRKDKTDEPYCVYISTFSVDEPREEVIETAKILNGKIKIYWTGRKPKNFNPDAPENLVFTGFLSYDKYYELISNADALLVLTTEDDCLQCGAYEGLNANVPLVISDNTASREYFGNAALYTKIEPKTIAETILAALEKTDELKRNALAVRKKREEEYGALVDGLLKKVENIYDKK